MPRLQSSSLILLLALLQSLFGLRSGEAQEVLDQFPITLLAGRSRLIPQDSLGIEGQVLRDLPFSSQRSYGYVGGHGTSRRRSFAFGGDPRWPIVWRENPRRYTFSLADGTYHVSLWFLETDVAVSGLRKFTIEAEGKPRIQDFDIAQEAGDFHWHRKSFLVSVSDGWLDLEFKKDSPLPPRISRIVIQPQSNISKSNEKLNLLAESQPSKIVLKWNLPQLDPAGYGIYRSTEVEGPYQSLVEYPVTAPRFVDNDVVAGETYYYRIQSFDADGGQSELSAPVTATSFSEYDDELLKLYLVTEPEGAKALAQRLSENREVEATLRNGSSESVVWVSAERSVDDWQFNKSYNFKVKSGKKFRGLQSFSLDAEAGDASFMRARLFHWAYQKAGLASFKVNPVHLTINGDYRGVYLMREGAVGPFRKRNRLDRIGNYTQLEDRGQLQFDWKPYGKPLTHEGSLWNLTTFVHELNRVEEGETEKFVQQRFYLDRVLKRLAIESIFGVNSESSRAKIYLGDSRNGKWEYFLPQASEGILSTFNFLGLPHSQFTKEQAKEALTRNAITRKLLPSRSFDQVESRLLSHPTIWKQYLDTVEALLQETFTEEALKSRVSQWDEQIQSIAQGAKRLWPLDGGKQLLAAPQAVLAHFESRRKAFYQAIAEERAQAPEPVLLNEMLLLPDSENEEGSRWIELVNRSSEEINLTNYRISLDPGLSQSFALQGRSIAPNSVLKIELIGKRHLPLSNEGGVIYLLKLESLRGRYRVCDVLHFARQSAGISYGRSNDDARQWGYFRKPSPGEPNEGLVLNGPDWIYRWKIELIKDRDILIWIRPKRKVEKLTLFFKPPEKDHFLPINVEWESKRYRYEVLLPRGDGDLKIPFYFLATSEDEIARPYPLTGEALPFQIPGRLPLFINEVLPRPSESSPHGEFIEIYNAGDVPLSIEGMFLSDSQKNSRKWRIPIKEPIPPKGFVVLMGDGKGVGNSTSFKLGNSGDYLGLFHRLEAGNVRVDHIAFAAIPTDQSWGRRKDGKKGGRFWKDPTPGGRNLPKIPEEYLRERKDAKKVNTKIEVEEKGPPLPNFLKKKPKE